MDSIAILLKKETCVLHKIQLACNINKHNLLFQPKNIYTSNISYNSFYISFHLYLSYFNAASLFFKK